MLRALLALLPALLSGLVPAPARGDDLSGVYARQGGRLEVLQAGDQLLLVYRASFPTAGDSTASCECLLSGRRAGGDWVLKGAVQKGLLVRLGDFLVVLAEGAECCGLGWPGRDDFALDTRAPLPRCRVRGEPPWYALAGSGPGGDLFRPVGGQAARGEVVEAVPDAPHVHLLPARSAGGPGPARVGLLPRDGLECLLPRKAGPG